MGSGTAGICRRPEHLRYQRKSFLGLVPLGRGANDAFDLGNEAAVLPAHHRSEILDDLLPTVCITKCQCREVAFRVLIRQSLSL